MSRIRNETGNTSPGCPNRVTLYVSFAEMIYLRARFERLGRWYAGLREASDRERPVPAILELDETGRKLVEHRTRVEGYENCDDYLDAEFNEALDEFRRFMKAFAGGRMPPTMAYDPAPPLSPADAGDECDADCDLDDEIPF